MIGRRLEKQNRQGSYKRILLKISFHRIIYNINTVAPCNNMKNACMKIKKAKTKFDTKVVHTDIKTFITKSTTIVNTEQHH